MKKFMLIVLAVAVLLSCTACGGDAASVPQSPADGVVGSEASTAAESRDPNEISVENLRSLPVTPVDDFDYIETDGGIKITSYNGDDKLVVLPAEREGVPVIGIEERAFANDENVKAVLISDSIITVGSGAFALCTSLELVVFGAKVETLEDTAFLGCDALREVVLNDGLKTIEEEVITYCGNLKTITIPASVETIEEGAFFASAEDLVIKGAAGSAAETYAESDGYTFEAVQ